MRIPIYRIQGPDTNGTLSVSSEKMTDVKKYLLDKGLIQLGEFLFIHPTEIWTSRITFVKESQAWSAIFCRSMNDNFD